MDLRRAVRPVRGAVAMLAAALVAAAVVPAVSSGEPLLVGADPHVAWDDQRHGDFGAQRVGSRSEPGTLTIVNRDAVPLEISAVRLQPRGYRYDAHPEEDLSAFQGTTDCPGTVLLIGAACRVHVTFSPLQIGPSVAVVRVEHNRAPGAFEVEVTGSGTMGLYVAGALGEVVAVGDARSFGDLSHVALDSPVLGIATTASGEGYWLAQASGTVWPFGDAVDHGSGVLDQERFVVGMAAAPGGGGYWLLGDDGSVYSFGDAGFFGSASGLLAPDAFAVTIAPTPSGGGYWVADDTGGVWPFGDAGHFGAPDELPPRYTITGFAPTASGDGYWLVDAAGGVFSYGDAAPFPRTGAISVYDGVPTDPVITAESTPTGAGLWSATSGGIVSAQGDAGFSGTNLYFGSGPIYGDDGEIERTFAVDMAANVRRVEPAEGAGTMVAEGNGGIRAYRATCLPECAG